MDNPKIDWIGLHLDFHKIHSDAGWESISNSEIERRFVIYHSWLFKNGLINVESTSIDKDFILYKNQITDTGSKFLIKVHDKFISLMKPGRTDEEDFKYLSKRYKQIFKSEAK